MVLARPARDFGSQRQPSEPNPRGVGEGRGREGLREPAPGQMGNEDMGHHDKGATPANSRCVPRGLAKLTGLQRELFLSFQAVGIEMALRGFD